MSCLPPPLAYPCHLFHSQICAESVLKKGDLAGVLYDTSAQVDLKDDLVVVVLEEDPTESVLAVVVLEDVVAEGGLGVALDEEVFLYVLAEGDLVDIPVEDVLAPHSR